MSTSMATGLAAVMIGVVYSLQAYNLPKATIGNPLDPLYFPMALGLIMVGCGLVVVLTEYRKKAAGTKASALFSFSKIEFSYTAKLIAYTSIVSILYGALLEEIGYVLSTFLFLQAILFAVNGKEQWKINSIVSLCFSAGIYLLFSEILGITLPKLPFLEI